MGELDELERRINAAMDRIEKGLSAIDTAGASAAAADDDPAALREALEEERTANAQLTERLRKIKERQDSQLAETQAQAAKQRADLEALDGELQRLRAANKQLRESNAALREANAEGVGEPHLINKAMLAELEALRAGRAVDVAEADAILSAMAGLVNGAGASAPSAAEREGDS